MKKRVFAVLLAASLAMTMFSACPINTTTIPMMISGPWNPAAIPLKL